MNNKQNSILWQRPTITYPRPFDTVLLDIDGVLIKTVDSFHATDIAVAEYVVGTLNKLDWGQRQGKHIITMADVEAFKQAGGYNNDWDMCYLLSALATSRLREWKDTPLATRSTQDWASMEHEAHLLGHGGRVWVEETFPASALGDYDVIGDLYHECYWGATEFRKRFGREPHYLPSAEGFVWREEMLYSPNFPSQLRRSGIAHLGMITGRVGPEVDSALERMAAHSGERWWEIVVSADVYAKPDPRALRLAIAAVNAQGGLYIGDTADDFELIRRYRADKGPHEPDMLAVMLVKTPEEIEVYKQRGADAIVSSVEGILDCLPEDRGAKR